MISRDDDCKPPTIRDDTECLISKESYEKLVHIFLPGINLTGGDFCELIKQHILPDIPLLLGWRVVEIMGYGRFGVVLAIQKNKQRRVVKIALPDTTVVQSLYQESIVQEILFRANICTHVYHFGKFIRHTKEFYMIIMDAMDMTLSQFLLHIDRTTCLKRTYLQFILVHSEPTTPDRAWLIFTLFFYTFITIPIFSELMRISTVDDIDAFLDSTRLHPRCVLHIEALFGSSCQGMRQTEFINEYTRFKTHIDTTYGSCDQEDQLRFVLDVLKTKEFTQMITVRYDRIRQISVAVTVMLDSLRDIQATHGDLHLNNMMLQFTQTSVILRLVDTGRTALFKHEPTVDILQFLRCLNIFKISKDIQAFLEVEFSNRYPDILYPLSLVTQYDHFKKTFESADQVYLTHNIARHNRDIVMKQIDIYKNAPTMEQILSNFFSNH
jgi:hypothetical protein